MNHETHEIHEKVLYREEVFSIQGAIYDVYRELGCGFLEGVYQECLEKEFRERGIPYKLQPELNIIYKGAPLLQRYKPDFICHEKIIIELKAVKEVAPEHKAQLLNYIKASGLKLGLLVNFGHFPKAQIERMVL